MTVRDEPARLREQLDHIAAAGGIVVSVIWQPARQVTLELGLAPYDVTSGYVIVSEHELSEAASRMSAFRTAAMQVGEAPGAERGTAALDDFGSVRLGGVWTFSLLLPEFVAYWSELDP